MDAKSKKGELIINNKLFYFVKKIGKFCISIKGKILDNCFQKGNYWLVIKIYNVINMLRTWLSEFIALIFSKNVEEQKNRYAQLYKTITVKEYCFFNKYKYIIIEDEQYRSVNIPIYFQYNVKEKNINEISPEIYVAEINNVKIIGENSAIIAGDYCLYDMAKNDNDNRYDLRFSSIKNINTKYTILETIDSKEKIKKAISLVGFAGFNYYHFTVELISRLQYIDKFSEYQFLPILIDEKALQISQYKEILQIVNINNHPIISIKKRQMYQIEKLVYPSYNSWLPINLKKSKPQLPKDFLIAQSAVEYIRNSVSTVLKINLNKDQGFKKIFISRKNTKNTRLINEKEIIEIAKKYDFDIIYPEELTFIEQVKVFSQSKYVIGSTGAAFTNILFCPEGATIMCIIPKEYKYYGYSTIAEILNLKSVFLDAKVTKKEKAISMECYSLDIKYFKEAIKLTL